MVTSLDQIPSDARIDAIVNLAGEPIANGLWTRAKREEILNSRLGVTRDVVTLIRRLAQRPEVLVSGSAIGWYGLRGDEELDEESGSRPCFTHDVCDAWERAARHAENYGVRVVCLRIGLVLGIEGGMLSRLLTPFEFGFGGRLGSGRQWMSWITRDDLLRLIAHVIAGQTISGAVNATAPQPVPNSEFVAALGNALQRPALLPVPASVLGLLGDFGRELLLGGQKVLPKRILASGFEFRHPKLGIALSAILGAADVPEIRRPLTRGNFHRA